MPDPRRAMARSESGRGRRASAKAAAETPAEKWNRIFPHRLRKAKEAIRLLVFARDRNYECTPRQLNEIVATLETAVREVKEALLTPGGRFRAPGDDLC